MFVKVRNMPKKKILYNPSLSIGENAARNGVTEDAIRYHIKRNNIDRRNETKVKVINECRKVLQGNPTATPYMVARMTKHSINTVKKYWDLIIGENEVELSNYGEKKHQKMTLRQKNNFYATHPSCTRDILKVEKFAPDILEPFCGTGTMAEVIKAHGHNVKAYDLIDRGYGEVADFTDLKVEVGKYDIITNPPYDNNLIEHLLKCIKVCKSKVAVLMPLHYLSGKERLKKLFSNFPPRKVYVYAQRINIALNAAFDKFSDAGTNMTIYAWFVWERGYKGTTELHWLLNGD